MMIRHQAIRLQELLRQQPQLTRDQLDIVSEIVHTATDNRLIPFERLMAEEAAQIYRLVQVALSISASDLKSLRM